MGYVIKAPFFNQEIPVKDTGVWKRFFLKAHFEHFCIYRRLKTMVREASNDEHCAGITGHRQIVSLKLP